MKFSELMERVRGRGVVVVPTPSSAASGGVSGIDPEIRGVCEDSRKVKAGDLLSHGGTKVDGARYIVDALNRGAVAVVYENSKLKLETRNLGRGFRRGWLGRRWRM